MVILKEMNYIVFRNRGRTALSVCIAALLVCCMSFYLGSIQTAESAEKNLAKVIPVTAQVVSRSGARTVGFEIDENHFANLMKADIKDAVYTASACANFQEQYRAGRAGCGHVRDGGERVFSARWRDGGEHRV